MESQTGVAVWMLAAGLATVSRRTPRIFRVIKQGAELWGRLNRQCTGPQIMNERGFARSFYR